MAPGLCFNIGSLSYTSTTRDDACSLLTATTYYSNFSIITVGAVLCSDSGCTTTAPQGFYSDTFSGGTSVFEVDLSGFVISYGICYVTPTPTPSITPTVTPTRFYGVQFQSCEDGSVFRFRGNLVPSIVGNTYYIENSDEFTGCATIVPYSGTGMLYDSDGVTFTSVFDCADSNCPRTNRVAAIFYNCTTGEINYFTIDEDTSVIGSVYSYGNSCYSLMKLGGPGGYYIGSPQYKSCSECVPAITLTPSITQTFPVTPSNTPTPSPCNTSGFCLRTSFPTLSAYSGYYTSTLLNYNSRLYYTGDGASYGVVYHTGTKWCLSNSLGGSCIISGRIPCYSSCPDLSQNIFFGGICPTPTPSLSACSIIDFQAYFDCEYSPPTTPTPTINCDNVDFTFFSTPALPTPTPDYQTGLDFNVFVMSQTPTSSVTPTPTPTPQPKTQVLGVANFNFVNQQFINSLTKVLIDCATGEEYYVGDQLYSGSTSLNPGTILSISINTPTGQKSICVTYDRVDTNFSPNSYINQIYSIYGYCGDCSI